MGIRFLDLRIKLKKHKLKMYHGIVYQHIDFSEVVTIMTDFLREHPTEFVIVRIKNE